MHNAFLNSLSQPGSFRSLLCLNGNLPDRTFFSTLSLPIIAVDGAANTLHKMGIAPQLILGDLDSVHNDLQKKYPCIYLPDQERCDFEKALGYLKENQLLPSIILGMNGGYLDHILNNFNILKESQSIFYDAPHMMGQIIHAKERKELQFPIHTKISLVGFPNAVLTSNGLKWNLTEQKLSFPGFNSFYNRTIQEKFALEVHKGSVILLIYLEQIDDAGSRVIQK